MMCIDADRRRDNSHRIFVILKYGLSFLSAYWYVRDRIPHYGHIATRI
jgi:hypothetical protein